MEGTNRTDSRRVTAWPAPRQQQLIALLILVAQIAILGWWLRHGGMQGRLIQIDQAAPLECTVRLDLNQCDWPELTLLPGISETMARRIIHDRELRGYFSQVDDIRRVRGIGPKKVERLRPYLQCRTREVAAEQGSHTDVRPENP